MAFKESKESKEVFKEWSDVSHCLFLWVWLASCRHIVILLSLKTALLHFSTAAVYSKKLLKIKIDLNSKGPQE